MIDSGRLRHRIRIERLAPRSDSNGDALQNPETGELLQDWVFVRRQWAAIEPLSAREFVKSQAMQSQVTTRIVVRWADDLEDSTFRFVHERRSQPDVVYEVEGLLPDLESGQEYVTATCIRLAREIESVPVVPTPPSSEFALDFSVVANSQYLGLVSVGGF